MTDRETQLKALMLRGLDGDAGSWRVLLTDMGAHLRPFFARRLFNGGADAEDLVQETLIAIHAKRATWDRNQAFTAWAFAIARHKLIDHLRRQGRRPTHPIDEASDLFAEHTVEDGATQADLSRCLALLPARQRRLIEDVRLRGLTVAEAAANHGYTVTAAKVSIHRSMKSLNARFASHTANADMAGNASDED
ncbi:sigma-70 family RNA polymerase sigma factor [Brevundimonas variabilis]|uniref:RNA polymerase sigma-70 factor (ECF subfamily) n=1 Tax=Brevundimonas variabilis TaxID=74312 RepID=A0A7W9FG11_9CAUL|nr:RNA polymerase sigma-70 factor (ECF subfamily) [Brevundimonas variabilis]